MFGSRRGRTVIGHGLKIFGNVTAEGLVEINGQIEGDLECTSLIVSPKGRIVGRITAEHVVVNGRGGGPHSRRRCGAQVAGARGRRYSPSKSDY
jgi:cytoskeletal protein CcmA (bactofilin family)